MTDRVVERRRCRPREHANKTVVSRAWVNCSERALCELCLEVSEG